MKPPGTIPLWRERHECVVLEIHPVKQSVRIAQMDASRKRIARGWCPVFGGDGFYWLKNRRVDSLKVGDIVEIKSRALFIPSGKFVVPRFIRVVKEPDRIDAPPTNRIDRRSQPASARTITGE